MATNSTSAVYVSADRWGVVDAVNRFVSGIDDADLGLLESAFTEDVVFDLRPVYEKMGLEGPEHRGRDNTVAALMATVGLLDTMHAVSNFRIRIDGDAAHLTCYALVQHFRPGEGSPLDHQESLLLGNRFAVDLVREGEGWRIRRIVIDNAWSQGTLALG